MITASDPLTVQALAASALTMRRFVGYNLATERLELASTTVFGVTVASALDGATGAAPVPVLVITRGFAWVEVTSGTPTIGQPVMRHASNGSLVSAGGVVVPNSVCRALATGFALVEVW